MRTRNLPTKSTGLLKEALDSKKEGIQPFKVTAVPDTGCTASLISAKLARDMNLIIRPTNLTLSTCSGQKMAVEGCTWLTTTANNVAIRAKFLVARGITEQVLLKIDPTCRLCSQANETLYHLMTDCEATTTIQMDIMRNKIPLPDMKWSVKDINTFIQHPLIHSLMTYDTQYSREIEYIDHNYSTDSSSL